MTRLQELYAMYGSLVLQIENAQAQLQQVKREIIQELEKRHATVEKPLTNGAANSS